MATALATGGLSIIVTVLAAMSWAGPCQEVNDDA